MHSALNDCFKHFNGQKLFGCIKKEDKTLVFICINIKSEETVFKAVFSFSCIKKFVDELYLDKNIIEAMVINVFNSDIEESGYTSQYEFRTALKEKLNKLEIPNYFISTPDAFISTALIATDLSLETDETVLIVSASSNDISVAEFKFTSLGYKLIRDGSIEEINKKSAEEIRQKILGSSNPKKIISLEIDDIPLKNFFKSKKIIVLKKQYYNEYSDKFILKTCKWMLDKTFVKYHILPTYGRKGIISCCYGPNEKNIRFVCTDECTKLPDTSTTTIFRSVFKCFIIFDNEIVKTYYLPEMERNFHRFEITVATDDETLETFNFSPETLDSIYSLPYDLEDIVEGPKLPVIGFYDNSSFILIHEELLGYHFLKSWNGLYGQDLFISFDQKKQKYFQDAWMKLEEKNTFVVFDLLKIMSKYPDDIEILDTWGFTIIEDEENPVLIEFDNFDGTKKAASPSFLMALLLRKHLKAIEIENGGKKPKKIAFWIYNELDGEERFNEYEMERIKEGLEDSCNLLQIQCTFYDC